MAGAEWQGDRTRINVGNWGLATEKHKSGKVTASRAEQLTGLLQPAEKHIKNSQV